MTFLLITLPVIFASSLVLTMVGLGGGLIFAPLFLLLGLAQPTAVAASLFLNGIAATGAAITYLRKGMVDFSVSLPLVVTSILAAPLGALTTHHVDREMLMGIMAVVIFLAALRMLLGKKPKETSERASAVVRVAGGGAIGLVIGFMGGLLGIGGGVFVVPLLIYVLKAPTKVAAASSIFIVCFSSFSGFVTHATLAVLDWRFLILAGLCSFAGGQLGSRLMSEKMKAKSIRMLFGVVLLAFCAKLIHKVLAG